MVEVPFVQLTASDVYAHLGDDGRRICARKGFTLLLLSSQFNPNGQHCVRELNASEVASSPSQLALDGLLIFAINMYHVPLNFF